ncbi:MAG: hypothetical protein ISP90_03295 [Nevskia sp.]|nr:hypothetical protein [Nevskia sp.]
MTVRFEDAEGYRPADQTQRWNQSFYFNFYDPACKVGCFIRIGILENLKESNSWCVFFMDGKPLFARQNLNLPYTAQRLDKGIEIAGMRLRALEPMKKTSFSIEAQDFSATLQFDQMYPMQDAIAISKGQEGSITAAIAHVHAEGPCRVTGTVTLRGGKSIPIAGKGFRDVAYGTRDWDLLRHYRLAWPIFDNGLVVAAVHGYSMNYDSAHMQMLNDGSGWVAIKSLEDRNTYGDDDMTIEKMDWKVVDARGRSYAFTGRKLFRWFFPADTFVLTEQMMEYRLSDGTLGYGLGECGYRFPWSGNGNW